MQKPAIIRSLAPRCLALLPALLWPTAALALISGSSGNSPVKNMGWPLGTQEVANLESRLGYWEGPPFGGGEYHFLYRTDTQGFNQALEVFSKIRAPRLELLLQSGPGHSFWLDTRPSDGRGTTTLPAESRVDWEMVVWSPRSWHRLYNSPRSVWPDQAGRFRQPVPPPQIVLYLGGGQIDWERVKVPDGIVVIDRRDRTGAGGEHVRVDVFDMATAQPVRGAKLTLRAYRDQKWSEFPFDAQTNEDGIVDLEHVRCDGHCQFIVTAEGYASRLIPWKSTGQGEERLKVDLAPSGWVTGVVVSETGVPLADVQVQTTAILGLDGMGYQMPKTEPVKTNVDGSFAFGGMPEGYVLLSCRKEGLRQKTSSREIYETPDQRYQSWPRSIRIEMSGAASTTCPATTRPAARRTQEIRGRIIDYGDQPVAGAEVCLGGSRTSQFPPPAYEGALSPSVRTDAEGRFNLSTTLRSAHSIVVVSPVPLARVLPDDVDREILIRLPETATLGINYDIPGDDENAQFVLQHRGWSYASKDAYKFVTVKARNGAPAAMVTLPAGEYSLARSRRAWMGHGEGGYSCESQKIELQPGQTLTLDVTRRQGQSLTGELVFPLDAIVSGANVLVQRAGSEQLDALVAMQKGQMLDVATCGAEGKWKTQLIPPGDYVLTAEAYAPPSEPSYASIVFEIQGPTYTGIARMTVPETGQAPPVLIPMEPVRAKTPNAARSARRR